MIVNCWHAMYKYILNDSQTFAEGVECNLNAYILKPSLQPTAGLVSGF